MSRQIGSALGVAIFVAIIGAAVAGPELYDAMRTAWWATLGAGLGAAALALALPGSAAELVAAERPPVDGAPPVVAPAEAGA